MEQKRTSTSRQRRRSYLVAPWRSANQHSTRDRNACAKQQAIPSWNWPNSELACVFLRWTTTCTARCVPWCTFGVPGPRVATWSFGDLTGATSAVNLASLHYFMLCFHPPRPGRWPQAHSVIAFPKEWASAKWSFLRGNGIHSTERLINFCGVVQLQLQDIVCKEKKEIVCKKKKITGSQGSNWKKSSKFFPKF